MKYLYSLALIILTGCEALDPMKDVYFVVTCPNCSVGYSYDGVKSLAKNTPVIERVEWKSDVLKIKRGTWFNVNVENKKRIPVKNDIIIKIYINGRRVRNESFVDMGTGDASYGATANI